MRISIRPARVVAFLAGIVVFVFGIWHAADADEIRPGFARVGELRPMSDERFWGLIEATKAYENDPGRQIAALRSSLAQLSVEDIEGFEATFNAQLKRSYSWDLWGAAYVIHGGASDDSFEYFRCWLISKGRAVFEKVLIDPDSLADLLAPKVEGPLELEEFAYVARNVWSEKAGRPGRDMPNAANMMYHHAPSGTEFEENPTYLARRYPKLWQRFGNNPL
jgi:hypothetical protein